MTFYYLLWASFFILSLPYIYNDSQHTLFRSLVPVIAIVAYIVACRVGVGADWYNYVNIYNYGESLAGESERFEPVFMLIRKVFNMLGFSYQGFFFVLSFMSMLAIAYIAKGIGIKNLFFVFLIYISTIFASYQLNTLRSGLMATCVWVALYVKSQGKTKLSIMWCLIGAGFHFLGIAFIPFLFVLDKSYTRKNVLFAIVLSYIALFFNFGEIVMAYLPILNDIERLSIYLDVSDSADYGISIGSLFNLSVFLYCFLKYHDLYLNNSCVRIVLNAMLIVILFSGFFNTFTTIVSRFGQVLNLSLIFIWPILFEKISGRYIRVGLLIPITVYLIMYYNKAFAPNSILGYSTIVPFQFEIASIFR